MIDLLPCVVAGVFGAIVGALPGTWGGTVSIP